MGSDEFGNRYYEDFNNEYSTKNSRRWVEFADYGKMFQHPKKIAPAWHGWLHYTYDEPPNVTYFAKLLLCDLILVDINI